MSTHEARRRLGAGPLVLCPQLDKMCHPQACQQFTWTQSLDQSTCVKTPGTFLSPWPVCPALPRGSWNRHHCKFQIQKANIIQVCSFNSRNSRCRGQSVQFEVVRRLRKTCLQADEIDRMMSLKRRSISMDGTHFLSPPAPERPERAEGGGKTIPHHRCLY